MVHLAAWVGPRVGELGALRRRDVGLDAGILGIRERVYVVEGGTLDWDAPKSAAGVRDVTLPPHLLPTLRRHMDAYTDADLDALVFTTTNGTPVTRNRFGDVFAKARVKASRPDLRVHDLRHTGQTSTLAVATEAELMHRMGHSTTAASRAYLHSTQEHSRAVADALSAYATSDNVVPLRPVHRRTKRDAA